MKHNLTNIDNNQIARYTYDAENQSQRVTITNSEFGDAIKEAFSKIEFPKLDYQIPQIETKETLQNIVYIDKIVKETEVIQLDKNIFLPQVQIIEKPIVIKEIEIVKIPEYIAINKIEIIEKPIVIKEYEKIPNLFKYAVYLIVVLEIVNLTKSLMK